MGVYCILVSDGLNFAGFYSPKTSADKRRLITIYMQRLLNASVIVAVVPRPNYPQHKPLRCKVTTFFTDTQKGTSIHLRFVNVRCALLSTKQEAAFKQSLCALTITY